MWFCHLQKAINPKVLVAAGLGVKNARNERMLRQFLLRLNFFRSWLSNIFYKKTAEGRKPLYFFTVLCL
jgi:hypothetical protein